jgi:hypothetical protein
MSRLLAARLAHCLRYMVAVSGQGRGVKAMVIPMPAFPGEMVTGSPMGYDEKI